MNSGNEISKKDLMQFISVIDDEKTKNTLLPYWRKVLFTLEYIHYTDVLEKINIRKKSINNLSRTNNFLSFYLPEKKSLDKSISQACYDCLFGSLTHIRHSSECNAACKFCYFYGDEKSNEDRLLPFWAYRESCSRADLSLEELLLFLERQIIGRVRTIGWLEKEPLLEIEKGRPVMEFLRDNKIYQFLYTNGILASKETLLKLKDYGLKEIRFNLQATDFSDKVLSNMEEACKILKFVCIETPMFSKSFNNFIKHKNRILNSGIKQINLPELQLSKFNLVDFKDEGMIYRHRRGYTSPISSRNYTYDLIEIADSEKWNIIINDCSNDTKFFRATKRDKDMGDFISISYSTRFDFLPSWYYKFVIEKYVTDKLKIL